MSRSVLSKVIRAGRAGALGVGLAVMLAVVLGAGTTALAAVPGDPFKLGKLNTVDRISQLVGTTTGAMLKVDNNGAGPALNLQVEPGKAPLTVSPGAGMATGLRAEDAKTADVAGYAQSAGKASDAEKLDGKDASEFAAGVGGKASDAAHADQADTAASAQNANTLDNKDSADFMTATLPAVRVGLQYQHYVESSSNQYAPVGFANEDFDQGGEMHTAANNTRLVAPRAGIYQVDVQLSWMTNGVNDGNRAAGVVMNQNGACNMYGSLAFDRFVSATANAAQYNHMSTLVAMNQGDYLEVCANQNSSNQQWINNAYTFASMHYVSGR